MGDGTASVPDSRVGAIPVSTPAGLAVSVPDSGVRPLRLKGWKPGTSSTVMAGAFEGPADLHRGDSRLDRCNSV